MRQMNERLSTASRLFGIGPGTLGSRPETLPAGPASRRGSPPRGKRPPSSLTLQGNILTSDRSGEDGYDDDHRRDEHADGQGADDGTEGRSPGAWVDTGGKIAYRIEDGRVTVHNPEAEHRDPVLAAFLGLIAKDIAAGGNVRDLPPDVAAAMRRAIEQIEVDLDERLEGDVAL